MAELAGVLNQMAASTEETIRTLSEDRAQMAATLTAMREGVMVLDTAGTVRLINTAMARMLGSQEADVVGRPYIEVIRHRRLNEFVREALAQTSPSATEITLGTSPERIFQVQTSSLSQRGPVRPPERAPMPPNPALAPAEPDARFSSVTGRSFGAVLVFHDITELRRLEQVRKDFVANVSHELRTPLTAIKGYIEALQDGAKDDTAQRDRFLDIIETHTDRLELIITELLLLSKLESGQIPLKQETVVLPALVDRTVELLRHAIEQKQHTVVVEVPEDLPPVLGDEEQLRQALLNLLDNATKYTPDHGIITISATVDAPMVEITVADTGIGIPSRDLPRIFERFYRVDKGRSRELGGTGLGLSIVKHVVEGHGGTITVESVPGKGSRFRVRLPMASAQTAHAPR